jgi:hypothetical protein
MSMGRCSRVVVVLVLVVVGGDDLHPPPRVASTPSSCTILYLKHISNTEGVEVAVALVWCWVVGV